MILNDGVVLSDTLAHLMPRLPGSKIEVFVQTRSALFVRDLKVTQRVWHGRIGVTGTDSQYRPACCR